MKAGHTTARIRQIRAEQDRAALIGYLPAGFPSVNISRDAMRRLVQPGDGPGVDLVEVGMPYSDPVMDGVTIQQAATRALQRGVRTRDMFTCVEAVAEAGSLAVVMIYWNLVERYGVAAFARDLAAAGGAGLITPDLTPDEGEEWIAVSDEYDLDRVFLVSPSSTDDRLASTVAACRGFVYATSVMGVTGTRTAASAAAPDLVARVRAADSQALVGVGLGVSNGVQAGETGAYADAVIVGSALVGTLVRADDAGRPEDLAGLSACVRDLADGVRTHSAAAGTSSHR